MCSLWTEYCTSWGEKWIHVFLYGDIKSLVCKLVIVILLVLSLSSFISCYNFLEELELLYFYGNIWWFFFWNYNQISHHVHFLVFCTKWRWFKKLQKSVHNVRLFKIYVYNLADLRNFNWDKFEITVPSPQIYCSSEMLDVYVLKM